MLEGFFWHVNVLSRKPLPHAQKTPKGFFWRVAVWRGFFGMWARVFLACFQGLFWHAAGFFLACGVFLACSRVFFGMSAILERNSNLGVFLACCFGWQVAGWKVAGWPAGSWLAGSWLAAGWLAAGWLAGRCMKSRWPAGRWLPGWPASRTASQ